ncbi:MAG: hypothetical protein R3C03_06140 [Pirellulaceae bacterium]
MLGEPGFTPYDLKFNAFGFPVRIHPAFFIMPLVLFGSIMRASDSNALVGILIIEAVVFLSILVHELGHALAFRFYGIDSHIALYWMGGLAIPGGTGVWEIVSLATDDSIFANRNFIGGSHCRAVACWVFSLAVYGLGGKLIVELEGLFPMVDPGLQGINLSSQHRPLGIHDRRSVCVFWNVLNLIPHFFRWTEDKLRGNCLSSADPWNGIETL